MGDRIIFGLDFGTSNSALSINRNGIVEVINADPCNKTGRTLKSILYFEEEEKAIFTGQAAINQYVLDFGMGRLIKSVKSALRSTTFDFTYIYGQKYAIDDLAAIILAFLKEVGEKHICQEVTEVVLGRPVYFSDDPQIDRLAEDRLKAAAIKAGFKEIHFQLEPIAAAFTVEKTLAESEEKIVLVGDFGGGTADFTVAKLRGNTKNLDRKNDILAIQGVYIGGDLFDSEIFWHKIAKYFGKDVKFKSMTNTWLPFPASITYQLRNWHLIHLLRNNSTIGYIQRVMASADNESVMKNLLNLILNNSGFLMIQGIESAKCQLSTSEKATIEFKDSNIEIREEITRKEFEGMIFDHTTKIAARVDEVVSEASLKNSDIDIVFLTGGSSNIPCIRDIFYRRFGQGKIRQGDNFTSVAFGLGQSANFLRGS